MGITAQDRDLLKKQLLEMEKADPRAFAELIQEVTQDIRDEPFVLEPDRERLIQNIFDEFEDTFRALA